MNLHLILPPLLGGAPPQVYHLAYRDSCLVAHILQPLPAGFRL